MGTPQDINEGLDLFRTLVFDNVVEAAILEFEGPVIAVPVIGSVVDSLEHQFADLLYNKLKGQIVFESVLFVDLAHRQAFSKASTTLQQIASAKGIDSQEFKDAHEVEKKALKKFGQFNVVEPGVVTNHPSTPNGSV